MVRHMIRTTCIIHNGHIDKYGRARRGAKTVGKIILEQRYGRQIDRHELACHTCNNPSCVNPDHIYKGSTSSNMRDMHRDYNAMGRTPPQQFNLQQYRKARS